MSDTNKNNLSKILKILANIVSWTLLTLLILVAGFLLYYVITSRLSEIKGDKFTPKFSLFTIVSPSMTPNINVYDIVVTEKVGDKEELKNGDVITFISTSSISSGMTITHRIVDVIETPDGKQYRTKGDANLTADYALVTKDKIIGKVKMRIPQVGRIQFFLSSKGAWLFIILIPAILIIALDFRKIFKLVDIKQKVKQIEIIEETEEEESLERQVEEQKKQYELKKKLLHKNNKNKYKRNKYESDSFLEEPEIVEVHVDKEDLLSRTQSISLEGLEELRNVILDEEETEKAEEKQIITQEQYVDDYIVPDIEQQDNSVFEEFIKELGNIEEPKMNYSQEQLDIKNDISDEIFAEENKTQELKLKLQSLIEDDDDDLFDLPKKIETREEEMDGIDLPVRKDEGEKSVIDIEPANPIQATGKIKVVGALSKK